MVPPDERTWITPNRSAVLRAALPLQPQQECNARLVILVVAEAMRVHAIASTRDKCSIAEMDYDLISDFGTANWAEDAQPLRLRLRVSESTVRILNVADFGKTWLLVQGSGTGPP